MAKVSREFREAAKKEIRRQRRARRASRATETTPQARQNYVSDLRDELDKMINRLNRMVGGLRQASSNPRLGFSEPDRNQLHRASQVLAKVVRDLDAADGIIDKVYRA